MGDREPPAPSRTMDDPKTLALAVLAFAALILLLHFGRPVLIPLSIAILLSFVLAPAVTAMARIGIPRFIGAVVVLGFLCAGVGFGAYTLTDEAMSIVESVPEAARGVRDRIRSQRRQREGALQKVERAATEIERAATEIDQTRPPVTTGGAADVQRVQVVEPAFSARDYLWYGGMGVVGFGAQFVMVLFLVYFLLVAGDLYKRKFVKIAGPTLTDKKITVEIMDEINLQITQFLRVLVFTSAIVAVVTTIALWWLGMQHPVIWGLIAGVLNTIPYLGPIVVTGALGVVSFMQFNDFVRTAYVCAVTLAITSLEGWLITPALMGRAARMNPVAIFVGLLFWTWLWGVWGTILAVPMLMMIKAVCDRVEDLQAIGELLGE